MKNNSWGMSLSVDLHMCDENLLKDQKIIKHFIKELCEVIKMKRVGPVMIRRFGHKDLRGYSVMQFIETSSIVAHFDESDNRVFIDIFSCKKYDPKTVIEFCKNFFKSKKASFYFKKRI